MQRSDQARFESSIEALRQSLAGRLERYEDTLVAIRSALRGPTPGSFERPWVRLAIGSGSVAIQR